MALRRQVGIIYGNVSSTAYDIAVSDQELKRLDYVEAEQDGQRVLGQVEQVIRRSSLSFEEAMAMPKGMEADPEDRLSASVHVIGYQDAQGRIQTPRTPFRAGSPVHGADQVLVSAVLGLQNAPDEGAYLGHVKGSRIPVTLSMDMLAQKHVSVLAKTGAGKSYTVGVILEEFLKANVPLVILDPHGEYGSLRHANLDDGEVAQMARFKVKPRSFDRQVREYALDTNLNPDAERLVLEGMNLEGRDIVDMLGGKLSGGQVGVLYQAIKEVKEYLPAYTLRDIMDGVARNKASSKWTVLNALEVLEATKLFDIRGTPVRELVANGQCSIINLKGVSPDIQEVVVTRITTMLWEARKRNEVPAHILVVEEAHNFCPERNVGNAVSGAVIRTVASEGRKFGLGLVIVSQRPAKIDKNVLSQCNTQVVLKITNPNDLKAIVQSVEGITGETADEVQRLPVGVALVAGGGLTQPVFVDVRPRLTKHGGKSVSVLHQEEFDEEDEPAASPAVSPSEIWEPAPRPALNPIAGVPFTADPMATRASNARTSVAMPGMAPAGPSQGQTAVPSPSGPFGPSGSANAASASSQNPTTAFPLFPAPSSPSTAPSSLGGQGKATPAPGSGIPVHPGLHDVGDVPKASIRLSVRAPLRAAPPPPEEYDDDAPQVHSSAAPPRRSWTMTDAREIHRVASRIGHVAPHQEPERTLEQLAGEELRSGRSPDARLQLYRTIAEEACLDPPACIRCPVRDGCQHHQKLQADRRQAQSPIRRLWGT